MRLPLWRRRQRAQLDEEIASHLRMAIADRVARGECRKDAERAARREFGNVELTKETTRDMWGWMAVDRLWQDVRYAWRTLWRSPGFAAVAILTLALGIGATTAIFSVINAVVLRPLPFPHSERLVTVSEMDLRDGSSAGVPGSVSYPNFFDWRTRNRVFESIACYRRGRATITAGGTPEEIPAAVVSAELFATLGVQPAAGRAFRRDEERAGSDVAVLSDELWRSRYGGGADIIGRKITVNRRPFMVVGVMPRGFRFPLSNPMPQLWVTLAEDARTEVSDETPITAQRGAALLDVIARLRPGTSADQARAAMDGVARALAREYPDDDGSRGAVAIVPQLEQLVGNVRYELLVLLAAVACVLLIACANIANLLLARGVGRAQELSVRSALGASRGRLVRQMLTESFLLSMLGTALGVLLAHVSLDVLVRLSPVNVRGLDEVGIDGVVLAFAIACAVATALLFGLLPALQAARPNLTNGLKESGRTTAGRRQHRLREGLVVAETALGVVLLIGAGLMLRSFSHLLQTSPGFDPRHVVTMRFTLPDAKYAYTDRVRFYDRLLPSLAALPGVQGIGAVVPLPLGGGHLAISVEQAGRAVHPSDLPTADLGVVSPGYFAALRIPIVSGREFTDHDGIDAPRVVVVDESFAKRFFPNENPIGKRIRPGLRTNEQDTPWREVVGVVGNVRHQTLAEQSPATFYLPYSQGLISSLTLVVRSHASSGVIASEFRKAIASHDPELAVADVRDMSEYLGRSRATARFDTLLLSLFAGLGLLLTAVGLYGVTATAVAERTHEFGVRVALGASSWVVAGAVMKRAVALTGVGLLAGQVVAVFASRLIAWTLYGVRPVDLVTIGVVSAGLLGVGVVAAWVPARRATCVDPIRALRCE